MARFDLTDFEWSVIQPLLPNKSRGVPRVDDRRVLNGIFWRLRTGAPWADIPSRYGPHMFDSVRAGTILLADRAYDSNALRERLVERGAWGIAIMRKLIILANALIRDNRQWSEVRP
jgi:transposase